MSASHYVAQMFTAYAQRFAAIVARQPRGDFAEGRALVSDLERELALVAHAFEAGKANSRASAHAAEHLFLAGIANLDNDEEEAISDYWNDIEHGVYGLKDLFPVRAKKASKKKATKKKTKRG